MKGLKPAVVKTITDASVNASVMVFTDNGQKYSGTVKSTHDSCFVMIPQGTENKNAVLCIFFENVSAIMFDERALTRIAPDPTIER